MKKTKNEKTKEGDRREEKREKKEEGGDETF